MTDGTTNPTAVEPTEESMAVSDVAAVADDVIDNIERVIVGHRDIAEHILSTVFARGHLLLEDVPGVGKTMLARAFAKSIDCSFKRVQFTPDLLPSDVTGVNVFNQQTREFEFQPGPVFANIVLGDEINRAPPKTQSALLEAMEEEQVTVDGETHPVPHPFTVFATQNAIERDRTYELPVAQIDRFMKNLQLGYPSAEEESEILDRIVGVHPIESLEAVTTADFIRRARTTVAEVTIEPPVRAYATALSNHTREHAALGVSPRGTILLLQAAQARAVFDGRDYVIPDDIQSEAQPVLAHRVRRNPDEKVGEGGREVIQAALADTSVK